MNKIIIRTSFGTNVILDDFYDYEKICIDSLKSIYDVMQYAIEQIQMCIDNRELPSEDSSHRARIKILKNNVCL